MSNGLGSAPFECLSLRSRARVGRRLRSLTTEDSHIEFQELITNWRA